MGRMKMIAFFKNPIVKNLFIGFTAIVIIASILSIPISNAGSQINVAFRAAPMGVNAGTKEVLIPELSPGQNDYKSKAKKYSAVFCISEGKHLSFETYTTEYNAYDENEASSYFSNYGSALWLFDNMYVANAGNKDIALSYLAELVTSPDVAGKITSYGKVTADSIKALNKTVGGKKDSKGNVVNRNFIETIEQLVLWNYTYNAEEVDFDKLVGAGFSGPNITDADQNAAKYLYFSLKYLADNNSGYKSNGVVTNAVSLDSSKAVIDVNNGKVGPYSIKSNKVTLNINDEYKTKISAVVTKADGTTQTLDSSKVIVNNDGSFYIDVKDCGQITKSKLNIADIYSGTTTTVEIMYNGKTQTLINVRKTPSTKPLSDEKELKYSGDYTLKLVKTKADGTTAITENPATFTVSGEIDLKKEPTKNDGTLKVVENKKIENTATTHKYTIVEDDAPKGFTKYDGTINVEVKFKADGTNYIIDENNTKLTADGTNGTARLNFKGNVIEIYVPNTEIVTKQPVFDLALRKFITKVDGKEITTSREPVINAESKDILDKYKTAAYHHTKQSLLVNVGSQVEYTIRIYNEGEIDGYAKEITDYLPDGLSFVKISDESSKLYTTDAKATDKKIVFKYNGSNVIKAKSIDRILNKEKGDLYQEIKFICKVNEGAKGYITNRAEITNYGYEDSEKVWHEAKAMNDSDRDSIQNTISKSLSLDSWYEQAKVYSYIEGNSTKTINDYYPGVQDDDDFETVEVEEIIEQKEFDLALRKFITNVNGEEITSRIPKVTLTEDFKSGKASTATYEHSKTPVDVEQDDIVTYTIRVYNEGEVDGYATKVMDDIPDGLEFLPDNATNVKYGWIMYKEADRIIATETGIKTLKYNKKIYVETKNASEADLIVTAHLKDELIKSYNAKTMETLDYKDVKVAFKVVEPNSSDRIITNYAQITEHKDDKGNTAVIDRDSTPNEWIDKDDDQDIEKIKLIEKEFDLALRKFITNINGKEMTSRIPKVTLTDEFKQGLVSTAVYEHTKEPVDVVHDDIVEYTIRVYNEGEVDGYATKIMDDIPDGLEYLPSNETNKKYGWKMYAESNDVNAEGKITYNKKTYVPTDDASKADLIITENLKDQIIKAYDSKTMSTLDYKDVKVAFKVVEPNKSDRILINYAQITEHKDSKNNVKVVDRDSIPNEWNEGEDDQDIEKIRLRYFDLALRKWVTEVIITENGQTQVTQTGHHAEDDPEDIVKVDLKKSKINDVIVKFRYSIRVTNEGEIAGYAKEVTDYIPEGLIFNEADNQGWVVAENNVVKTEALANTLLNPGESAEVTIVLTWVNNANNMGVKINTAEISKDYNDYKAKDIDSTPNNKKENEDDIDTAPVMLTVKTGSQIISYISLAVVFISIITVGVYTIKRRIV